MAFVRKKTVRGSTYLYLVENRRVDGKVRQTVLKYLGPAKKGIVVVRRPSGARRHI